MLSRAAAMQEARDGRAIEAPVATAAEASSAQPQQPAAAPAAASQGRKKPERS